MIHRAKELSIAGKDVVFCIGKQLHKHKTLLQFQLENEFDDDHSEHSISKRIQVKSIVEYDPSKECLENADIFMDKFHETDLEKYSTSQKKSICLAMTIEHTLILVIYVAFAIRN